MLDHFLPESHDTKAATEVRTVVPAGARSLDSFSMSRVMTAPELPSGVVSSADVVTSSAPDAEEQ